MTQALSFRITCVEEIRGGLWGIRSTVGTNVERFGGDGEPAQITNDWRRTMVSFVYYTADEVDRPF